jgi:hypothetical protein
MIQHDYSLAALERKAAIEKGSPLTPEESVKIKDLSRRYREADEAIAKKGAEFLRSKIEGDKTWAERQAQRESDAKTIEEHARKPVTDEARLRATEAALDRSIADIEEQLRTGNLFPERKTKTPLSNPAIEARRARLEALKADRAELREQAEPRRTPEEQRLRAAKSRRLREIADMKERIAKNDLAAKPKPEPVAADRELIGLERQKDMVRQEFNKAVAGWKWAQKNKAQKTLAVGLGVMRASKAFISSFDLSAMRQAAFEAYAHPIGTLKRVHSAMLKPLLSEENAFAVEYALSRRANARDYMQTGLLTRRGETLAQMEEAYMSEWVNKIPGVAASNRAFTTFLNVVRADRYDAMKSAYEAKAGTMPIAEKKAIAGAVQTFTGRGTLHQREQVLVGLNTAFWAPRLVLSRFQTLVGQPLWHGNKITKNIVAKEYGRFLAGVAATYGLIKMGGGDVEGDPRSSNFGKIKVGNTMVDPMGGLIQATVLMARMASGQTKTRGGKTLPLSGETVPFGGSDRWDVLTRFARTKLHPGLGAAVNVGTGKDITGQKMTLGKVARGTVIPMALGDVYEAMKAEGVPKGVALGVLSIFGAGLQTENKVQQSIDKWKNVPMTPEQRKALEEKIRATTK